MEKITTTNRVLSSEDLDHFVEELNKNGWRKGLKEFLSGLSSFKYEEVIRLLKAKQTGLKFLLDFSKHKRGLNIDTSFGSSSMSLAQNYDKLYVLNYDRRIVKCIERRIEESNTKNVTCISPKERLPMSFQSGYFDVVVIQNIEEGLGLSAFTDKEDARKVLYQFLKEVHRILTPEGCFYIGAQNKHGYDMLLKYFDKDCKVNGKILSVFGIKKIIERAQFRNEKVYSLYPGSDQTQEVIDFGQTVFNGDITIKERLKSHVFNNRLFKYFSQAACIVACKNGSFVSFLDTLLFRIKQNNFLPAGSDNSLIFKRYLVLHDKVILTVGTKMDKFPKLIVKLPLCSDSAMSTRHEIDVLNDLRAKKMQICKKTPVFHYEGELFDQSFFVFSGIKGFSVDLPLPEMKRVVLKAAEMLAQFHHQTRIECKIGEEELECFFLTPINRLGMLLEGEGAKELEAISNYLAETLIGKKINLVYNHGDFYHENILIDPKTLEITGIIDWEMSEKRGLPLLDLLYLWTRTEMLFKECEFPQVLLEKIFPVFLSNGEIETDMFRKYVQLIYIPKDVISAILIMFWVNHTVNRSGVKFNKKWLNDNFYSVIKYIKKYTSIN